MANRDLLKEAIADAKALKETAIANAKAALEEAFEPRLKSMLSTKLEEMELEEEKEDEVKEMAHGNKAKKEKEDSMEEGHSGSGPKTQVTDRSEDYKMIEEDDLDEILAELEEEMKDEKDMKKEGAYGKMDEDPMDEAMYGDKKKMMDEDPMDEAMYGKDRMEEDPEKMEEDSMYEQEEDEMKMDDMDMDIDLEDMSEDDLKSFIEDVIADMVEAGELEPGDEFEADKDGEEEIDIEDEKEEIMEAEEVQAERMSAYDRDAAEAGRMVMDKLKRMSSGAMMKLFGVSSVGELMAALGGAAGAAKAMEETKVEEGVMDKLKSMSRDTMMKLFGVSSVDDLMAALGDAAGAAKAMEETKDSDIMEEVNALRAELHEVNLLNAKLLYTNKIFRAKNLKEAQKVKVLEAFDKAETVKEVKLVFETMNDSLANVKKQVVKENLGRASKAAGVAPQTKSNIVDVDPQFARMQKLAGLR